MKAQSLMDDLRTIYDQAVEQHQAGRLERAEPLYRQILEENPGHLDALYLLGTLVLQRGDNAQAIQLLEQLRSVREDVADVHNNLGIAYNGQGRWEDAARAFQRAIKARPDYAQAHFNLGSLLEARGNLTDAEHCYRQTIDITPDDAQALFNLGHVLKLQQRWDDAEDCYVKLRSLRPHDLDGLVNLGFVLVKREKLDAAVEVYHQILVNEPGYYQIHNNLSYVFERQGRLADAEASARHALDLQRDYAEGWNNLGTALRSLHRLDEASDAYREAARLRPNFPLAEFNFGTTRLLAGDFAAGWPGYELRSLTLDTPPRKFDVPRWSGQPLVGGKLLVHSDQGFGDALQFIRYVPRLKELTGADVVLECQPDLVRLFQGFPGVDQIVADGTSLPPVAAECALSSLPAVCQTTLASIPAETPYLRADPEITSAWSAQLKSIAGAQFKVGIVWQGNVAQARNPIRSCSVIQFAPLSDIPGVQLFSLQKGDAAAQQLRAAEMPVVNFGNELGDFADAAGLVAALDLVIAVDTAVVHLAGALGRPVWTVLSSAADWRWLLDRADCPWYPTMRLFRQRVWGDWPGVFAEVADALRQEAHSSRSA